MLKMRMDSLLSLTGGVFMNRIRTLVYKMIYNNKKYEGKRVSNLIYHLKSDKKFSKALGKIPGIKKPTQALHQVADIAADMPTELWDQTTTDWNKMVEDPYVLLQERLPDKDLPRPPKN